jgi:hypothetical protein
MTLTFADIETHVHGGKTAAEIAEILAADTRHVRDVMATSSSTDDTDLLDVFGEFGLLSVQPDATWTGPLVTAVAAQNNEALTAGFNRLLTNLQITNRPVRCGTNASVGYLTTALTQLSLAYMPDSAADIAAAMLALTGGPKFAGVTEADVQALIDTAQKQAIRDAAINDQQALITPLQSKLNAMSAWLETEAAQALTVADYQAYADALTGTIDGNPA